MIMMVLVFVVSSGCLIKSGSLSTMTNNDTMMLLLVSITLVTGSLAQADEDKEAKKAHPTARAAKQVVYTVEITNH